MFTTQTWPTCNSSPQRSESSPDLQALLRKAKAKLRAALEPTLANPAVAFSTGFTTELERRKKWFPFIWAGKCLGVFVIQYLGTQMYKTMMELFVRHDPHIRIFIIILASWKKKSSLFSWNNLMPLILHPCTVWLCSLSTLLKMMMLTNHCSLNVTDWCTQNWISLPILHFGLINSLVSSKLCLIL